MYERDVAGGVGPAPPPIPIGICLIQSICRNSPTESKISEIHKFRLTHFFTKSQNKVSECTFGC